MNICTIVAKNYLAHARVLAESFHEHHPDGTCFVLVIDEVEGYIDAASEPFELVTPAQLSIDNYEHMAAIYDVLELSTAVKPWLLSYLFNERGLERVTYFDPDIRIFDRLDEIEKLTQEHNLVLIPHITSPLPRDGKKPTEADILISGTYNLGFIALERGHRTNELLNWWSERLKTDCVVEPAAGYFVDQRWMDFVHGVMPGFYVLRDPSYNVAYWNLHGRNLTFKKSSYYVDGRPLRFFHFSGFDPQHQQRLSKHQSRIELRKGSALARICGEYADALLANGYEKTKDWPYTYGVLPNGVKLDPGMHRLYRKGKDAGAPAQSIFTPEGADRFIAWLNEPAPVGGEHGITRYLYEIYSGRSDLRQAFPNLDGPDAAAFLEWTRIPGNVESPYPKHPSADWDGHHHLGSSTGVNVAGYFRAELGVGETARQVVAALETQNIPTATVGLVAPFSRQGHEYETDTVEPSFPINLLCVNADSLPAFVSQAGPQFFVDRYSIGLWWWEVGEFPERFVKAFDHVDEVWVGSHFVADAIAPVSPVPVVKVPMSFSMPEIKEFNRAELGLPEGFLFLFVFDHNSVFERKNPLALIEAFEQAFPPGSGASLVLKSINDEHHPEEHERLLKAAGSHPDIYVIDRYISADEKNAMFAGCDCYVSLHRSEGLGNTLAEAMYLGKPIIATGYSGNLEFMTPQNSYLVDYRLRPVGGNANPYPATAEWAEPDVGHAANLMRYVFEHQKEARERGQRAAADISRNHSPEAAGRAMARRLQRIEARLRAKPDVDRVSPRQLPARNTDNLRNRIMNTPAIPEPQSTRGRLGGLVRQVVLRSIYPFAMQQRTINDQLLDLIRGVDESLRDSIHRLEVRLSKNYADVSGAVNEHRTQIEKLVRKVDEHYANETGAINEQRAQIEKLARESRAIPYMAGSPFEVFENSVAGRVQGYAHQNGKPDRVGTYDAFEDIFRGPEYLIRERQRVYLRFVDDREPVLDIGCGRGEFLDLLRERGLEYVGVEPDPDMVERCRKKGHERVELTDGNSYLERCADDSIGLIFCAQVIEHMPHEEMLRFFELGLRKLKPGGLLIVETINPHSAPALKTFWVDPTHHHPIFPEVTLAFCRIKGFESAYMFHPNGTGDVETDRYATGEYAVVATKATRERIGGNDSQSTVSQR